MDRVDRDVVRGEFRGETVCHATALGLVAAIPAVMIYNVLARSTAHYRALIGDASEVVMNLAGRDLDRGRFSHAFPRTSITLCGMRMKS